MNEPNTTKPAPALPITPGGAIRRDYLVASGIALLAAFGAILQHVAATDPDLGDGRTLIILAVVVLGFGASFWVRLRATPMSASHSPASFGRLRKMAILWLALAFALAYSLFREPVEALWTGRPIDISPVGLALAGLGILATVLAAHRIVLVLRRAAPAAEDR